MAARTDWDDGIAADLGAGHALPPGAMRSATNLNREPWCVVAVEDGAMQKGEA